MKPETGNLLDSIPENFDKEVFTDILRRANLRIERIVSYGHSSPAQGWYDQDENEWVMVLKGEATISLEHEQDVHLTPGSHIDIPAHLKHRVSWTKPDEETIWLAVHYR